jgi:hypothetical protein
MQNQPQKDDMQTVGRRITKESKAASQPLLEVQMLKERLNQYGAGKRGELLLLEPHDRKAVGAGVDLLFSPSHEVMIRVAEALSTTSSPVMAASDRNRQSFFLVASAFIVL